MGRLEQLHTAMGADAGRPYLICCHREGVDIGLFLSDALFQPFRCHITNASMLTSGSTSLCHDEGIADNARDPEVSDAGCALPCDQDVPLSMEILSERAHSREIILAYWIDTTVHNA